MAHDPPRFFTVAEATERLRAAGLRYHESTVQRWCRDGWIDSVKPAGRYHIAVEVIDELIAHPDRLNREAVS